MKYTNTIKTAKELLGCYLIHETAEGIIKGMIVETEAYLSDDPAAHSFNGKTLRNSPMFGKPGTAYVYFTYGMHYCFNVVTNVEGVGEAVLIRAVQPVEGIGLMKQRRNREDIKQLCNGPAKLVQAFGITKENNFQSLDKGSLRIEKGIEPEEIIATTRVGISKAKEEKLRFYIKDNGFLS